MLSKYLSCANVQYIVSNDQRSPNNERYFKIRIFSSFFSSEIVVNLIVSSPWHYVIIIMLLFSFVGPNIFIFNLRLAQRRLHSFIVNLNNEFLEISLVGPWLIIDPIYVVYDLRCVSVEISFLLVDFTIIMNEWMNEDICCKIVNATASRNPICLCLYFSVLHISQTIAWQWNSYRGKDLSVPTTTTKKKKNYIKKFTRFFTDRPTADCFRQKWIIVMSDACCDIKIAICSLEHATTKHWTTEQPQNQTKIAYKSLYFIHNLDRVGKYICIGE